MAMDCAKHPKLLEGGKRKREALEEKEEDTEMREKPKNKVQKIQIDLTARSIYE